MAKGPNKATRKLIKKGRLDHTARVAGAAKKKGAGGRFGKKDDSRRPGSVGRGGHRGRGRGRPHGHDRKGQGGPRKPLSSTKTQSPAEEEEEEETKNVGGGIEDMDVDAFMNGGMFGLDPLEGKEGKAAEAGSDEEDDDEDDEDFEDEDEDDDDDEEESGPVNGQQAEEEEESSSDEGSDDDGDNDLKDEMAKHKAELEELKAKDPEFFKFLKEHDNKLLSFGEDDDEEEGDDEEDEEGEEEEGDEDAMDEDEEGAAEEDDEDDEDDEEEDGGRAPAESRELTMSLLQSLEHATIEQHSQKALRKLVLAFKAASHMADEQSRSRAAPGPYSIVSSAVFDRLLVVSLSHLPDVFGHHILGDASFSANDPSAFAKMASLPGFKQLKPVVYRCLKALHYLLNQITDPSLLGFILSCLERFVPFLLPFQRQAKLYLKTLLQLWGSNDARNLKVAAFLRIRQLALTQPFPFIEHCLKGLYLTYARHAKFMTEASLPGLTLMGNCLVELYGLDMTSSYQHAFVYLRQLALHLRGACTKKTKEALQKVQSWQFLNCLRAWAAVLTAYPGADQLQDLFFPLIQITLGVAKLVPSSRYYPLLFHCVNLIQRLSARAKVFVPCAAMLLDVLENPGLCKKPKASTDAAPNLHMAIRLGKDLLDPKMVQDSVVDEALDLLRQEVLVYRYTIAFPEYAFPIKERLKRFQKAVRVSRWKALAKGLVEELDKRSAFVSQERAKREMAPTQSLPFEALLPSSEPEAYERVRVVMDDKLTKLLAASAAGAAPPALPAASSKAAKAPATKAAEGKPAKAAAEGKAEKKKAASSSGKKGKALPQGSVEQMEDEVGELDNWSDDEEEEEEEGKEGEEGEEEEGEEQEEDDDDDDDDDDEDEDEEE